MPERPAGPRKHVAVIGGGVAGLAVAVNLLDEAADRGLDLRLTLLEKEPEPGGNLRTLRLDGGWQLEWGPNGFLDNEPATLRLVERVGIKDELLRSSDLTRHRFLLVGGRLQEIPTSPGAFLRSGLLSGRAKLRMAGELFVPARKDLGQAAEDPQTDETIDEFGRRRLGSEFAEVMLDPMVKGVFGGDSRRLSLAAAFPRMVELERDHGGLFRAMFALARGRRHKTDAGPSGVLHSFRGGMQALITALAETLTADGRCDLVCGADIQGVMPQGDLWRIAAGGRDLGPFDAVVHAAPAHAAAVHLRGVDAGLGDLLAGIPFAPMAVIALGYPQSRVGHDLRGFGVLIPTRERRDLLGALWTSSIFSGRAPEGMALLTCMAGGAANPAMMDRDDGDLIALARRELGLLLGLRGDPVLTRVIRHPRAIAQYERGHLARLRAVQGILARYPGLYLSGSSYGGISVNACCKEAETKAREVVCRLAADDPAGVPVDVEAR